MNKYLVFICFGILLFILWNKIDKFNISSQFNIPNLDFSSGTEYACPADILRCLQCMQEEDRPCVLNSFLNLLYLITYGDIDTVFQQNPDFLGMLNTLETMEEIPTYLDNRFYQDTLNIFPSNLLDNSNLSSGENNASIIIFKDQTDLYDKMIDPKFPYIDSMPPINKNLTDHIEINKIYIASISIFFLETQNITEFLLIQNQPYPQIPSGGITESGFGHALLLYRTETTLYLIESSPATDTGVSNILLYTRDISIEGGGNSGKVIIDRITKHYLDSLGFVESRHRQHYYRLLILYKFKSKNNDCAAYSGDNAETAGA